MTASPISFYRLGLIGYPLEHSASPRLHQAALGANGLQGEYRLYAIPPTADGLARLRTLISLLRAGEIHGFNVTIPHKQNVLQYVDRLSQVAQAAGAVNTLYLEEGQIVGDNTDVPGFLCDLNDLVGDKRAGNALLLGAGGAARGIAYALSSSGWRISILARRPEQADAIARGLPFARGEKFRTGEMTGVVIEQLSRQCDLVVNTTPLGMYPNLSGCPWPEDLPFPKHAAVYDLVYNPLETVLVHRAKEAGLRARNGAGMLIAQAALAFQKWTCLESPYEVMERAFYQEPSLDKT